MKKYSIQFELYGEDSDKLIASAIKLGAVFCEEFPVSSEPGYICYQYLPSKDCYFPQEFWCSTVKAKTLQEAYDKATDILKEADTLEKPFPINLPQVRDVSVVKSVI